MASNVLLRRVLAAAALAVVPACGVFVGIKELDVEPVVDSGAVEPVPDASDAGEVLVDASEPEVFVPPVIDAGCKILSKGPLEPKNVTQKGGGAPWGNLDNGKTADDKATETSAQLGTDDARTILFTGYDVGVPRDAKVFGVKAEIRAKSDGRAPDFYKDRSVMLTLGDAPIGANLFRPDSYPSSFQSRVYGGETNPWDNDLVLTPAIVNALDFGIEFRLKRTPGFAIGAFPTFTFSIDVVQITVFYCE